MKFIIVIFISLTSLHSASFAWTTGNDKAVDGLRERARRQGSVRVLVQVPVEKVSLNGYKAADQLAYDIQMIARAQDLLLLQMDKPERASAKRFAQIPFIALEVNEHGIDRLLASSDIVGIYEDVQFEPSIFQSVALLGASAFGGATGGTFSGFSGAGRTVAILDTGVNKTHPLFNGRVVSEACYSTVGGTSQSFCPGGVSSSTASGSGVECNINDVAACSHGTHIAGIAAGGNPAITGNGVARNANVISIKIFSRSTDCIGASPCARAFTSDIILGLERVLSLRTTYSIDAVNLSVAAGQYGGWCDTNQPALKAAIDNLRMVKIATIAPSGNDGAANGLSSPGCISSAVSVGSTKDGTALPVDGLSTFSNSAHFLTLLAPGEIITSAYPGGSYDDAQGTSQAAAHVTGAFAVIREKFTSDSVTTSLNRIKAAGLNILDARNSVTKPRIRLNAALTASPTAPTYTLSGRVVGTDGRGIRNATLTLVDADGVTRTTMSLNFGNFSFQNLPGRETYGVSVNSRRFSFQPTYLTVNGNTSGVSFVGSR